jgi:hypothetical protein
MHYAPVTAVVVHCIVLSTSIVPEGKRAGLPLEATGKFRLDLVLEQVRQQRLAFLLGPPIEVCGVADIHVERFALGLGMSAHNGMPGGEHF